jgi:signal peptidase II
MYEVFEPITNNYKLTTILTLIFAGILKFFMKARTTAFIIILIVVADQALKFYIKTNYIINESHHVFGNWFRLLFVENEGMAYGMKLGGNWGKIILTVFRLLAVIFGVWYLRHIIQKKQHAGFIFCAALIFAGALGNLIDSLFYGMIFDSTYDPVTYVNGDVVAKAFSGKGYGSFLHGKVVDMLYFPIIRDVHFPQWVPFWGGEDFEFFRPIFNIADASISSGVIALLLFQKKFFGSHHNDEVKEIVVNAENTNNVNI